MYRNRDFRSPFPWFHIFRGGRRVFQTQFVGERGAHNLWLNCQFSRKGNVIYYIMILFAVIMLSPRPTNYIGNKPNLFVSALLCSYFFPICKKILNLRSIQFFLTSGIGTDIFLINVLEDRIEFLTWAAWALFHFYLKQKQRFSVWSFTENASYISFHRGIWSSYSEINRIKRSKGLLISPEITKAHYKM